VGVPTSSKSWNRRRIPNIVHQTSKSRCVTPAFFEISNQWKFQDDWEYYFHDDDAMERLLHSQVFPEFPNLLAIWRNCVTNGTLKADLWRYLVLWVYGGIYADLDTAPNPNHFFPNSTIADTDDGFFVVEQYHVLSQWFMAVSPRHPLVYYAIHYALLNLLEAPDTHQIGAPFQTGPHALHAAFRQFRHDVGVGVDPAKPGFQPVSSGIYTGTNDRSITVVGVAEDQNQYIQRMAIKAGTRQRDYQKMGMTHFLEYTRGNGGTASGMSCMAAILNDTTVAV
jgi:mannosyltransferase OCH1-like enzyme